jgi:hypothetical protein
MWRKKIPLGEKKVKKKNENFQKLIELDNKKFQKVAR